MYVLLTILIVLASILLTLLVLVQNSKGGGLAAGFTSSNQIMGVRKTTDFLEKATWSLAAFIILLSIATVAFDNSGAKVNESEVKDQFQGTKQAEPGVVAPGFGETPAENQTQDTENPPKQ